MHPGVVGEMRSASTRRKPRPRSRPPAWRHHPLIDRRRLRRFTTDPLKRAPKGLATFWTRARRLLWSWWPWLAACVFALEAREWWWAFGAGAMATISYLLAPVESPPRYGLDHEFPVESPEFLTTIAGAIGVPFTHGNRIDLLHNGDEFFPAMLTEIARAEYSVTIEAYIYWEGEIGRQFAAALAERAQAGVRVKILLDAIGSSTIGNDILQTLESGGCQIAWYNPLHWYSIGRYNNRTHRKSLIVDGRVGFTGGAGIADHWLGHAQDEDHWRDTHIRIEGPAVVPLQTGFAQNWLERTQELISGPLFYPPLDAAGPHAALTIMSSPVTGASTVRMMYYLSIICARRAIWIANPYFVPDAAAIETLIEAKRRGVDVKIMVSGMNNDNWLSRHNSIRLYGRLLAAGIEIYEYTRTLLHQKTMVVDGVWATVGTTNFDSRSFSHNEENNVCFYDAALVRRMEEAFTDDLKACTRITLVSWRQRGVLAKGQEVVAALLQEQV
jgi:cardiolipin synthase